MIPEHKQTAVKKALQAAFHTDAFEHIQPLTKGLSGALIFKITVHDRPYLLRVITRTDAIGDPAFYYGCMEVAAENTLAPAIRYLSSEDRISITDFVTEKPFSVATARATLPQLLRQLHNLPKFPYRMNYFESMERFMPQLSAARLLPEEEIQELYALYERIARVYPKYDLENWVSSHNDSKPDNIVFDGQRPWLVDWESAFLNDRYLDLAIVANFIVTNEAEEAAYLAAYFEETADDYRQARFFLMQQLLHFYYFLFLRVIDKSYSPTEQTTLPARDFREFHNGLWQGEILLTDTEAKREYARLHLEQFRQKAQTPRFEASLRLVGYPPA
ncbi:MAG: phosphotransferase [Spirosomataceae bacterium]